jgi:hydroxymethylbilane synthase
MLDKLVIATRESPLALWQANHIKEKLSQIYANLSVDILGMTTEGDRILGSALSKVGGKGLFIKELEVAMLEGKADIAVHSMKDLPVELPNGFCLAAVLDRHEIRDAFVSNKFATLRDLPRGSVVGTSSLRRESQLRNIRPDIDVCPLRGNVQTRLKKLDAGDYDGIMLAAAGLERLGLRDRIREYLDPSHSIPAVGQGALGIECRSDREDIRRLVEVLNDTETRLCVEMERSISRNLGGSCSLPLGAYARVDKGQLKLDAFVSMPDGSEMIRVGGSTQTTDDAGMELSASLADKLKQRGAAEVLAKVG